VSRVVFIETSLSGSGMAAIRQARSLGCDVTLLTRDLGYYAGRDALAPAELHAFATVLPCDTNSAGAVVAALAGSRVDAVLSAGEYHVEVAAEVAHRLGVPGLSRSAGHAARDKVETVRRCVAAGVPVPRQVAVRAAGEVPPAVHRLGLPLVVKPVDGTASVDARLCTTAAEVGESVARILRRTHNARGQRCARAALLAEYVRGAEVSVETLSWAGQTAVLGITAKRVGPLPYFVEIGHTFPAPLPEPVADRCTGLALAALDAIGLRHGAAHTELILGPDGPLLLEVNARPAGDQITELVRLATGIDPLREWVASHLPGMAPRSAPTRHRAATIRYLTPPPGVVTAVGDLTAARQRSGVHRVVLHVAPGDVIAGPRSSHDRPGYVITSAVDPAASAALAESVQDSLPIEVRAPQLVSSA